ncbi:MAG: bifunctional [glutamate--ammonia ligase]-adenylyl-L-tyrosine phosphorylase/[glutamate--ammonia-ligase] adenylyltransferase [Pseudomonadota bacterium]
MSDLERALERLSLPDELRDVTHRALDAFIRECPVQAKRLAARGLEMSFLRTLATSDYFVSILTRQIGAASEPGANATGERLIDRLLADTAFDAPGVLSVGAPEDAPLDTQRTALRQQRHLNLARILWRANGEVDALETTLDALSALADHQIRQAVTLSHTQVVERTGEPNADRLCVLAMGKLGGGELNVSSDIDLILTHAEAGETDGKRSVTHTEFFARQAKVFADLLATPTAEGFCYRLDTRLRPFGASGQPVVNLAALEHYLATHGREWERYAYIKQRTLTGGESHVRELNALVQSFVYRKYMDYGVYDDLRAMKALIDEEVTRSDLQSDIKRGPGGIRSLEFMVQTLQLVFGGKFPALQTPSFFIALKRLAELDYLPEAMAQAMIADYRFLRRVENGIQGIRDQQTHVLPTAAVDQQRLALLLNTGSYAQLEEALHAVRTRVQALFDDMSLLSKDARSSSMTTTQTFDEVDNNEALRSLQSLRTLRGRLEKTGQARFDQLMPCIVERLQSADDAEYIAPRLTRLLTGIGRRSAYFSLLLENPAVLERVISICRRSPDLADQLAISPVLLDTLVDPRGSSAQLDRDGLEARLQQQLAGVDHNDEEAALIALREFRKAAVFDVAVADLEKQMPLMKISDRLTDIAELTLEQALSLATDHVQARYGVPRSDGGQGAVAAFAIIGYGKLGGIELGFGSDLDLVFLFDDDGNGQTDGEKSVDNSVYFAKLSRRLIHVLTVPTRAGTLYEVDMRLRPSGRSGLLVSRLSAFADYQQKQAWTWEHQAMIRARAVAGDATLKQAFEGFRLAFLSQQRPIDTLRRDVRSMRIRMKKELDKSTASHFDLKQGDGGIVDLEFLVQFLVLAHAAQLPDLAVFSDNVRQLEAIERAGVLDVDVARALRAAYLTMRRHSHTQALAGGSVLIDQSAIREERALVTAQFNAQALAPESSPDILS